MTRECFSTELTQHIGRVLTQEVKRQYPSITSFAKSVEGVNESTVKTILYGKYGYNIRHLEAILNKLNLKITIIPKTHQDIID